MLFALGATLYLRVVDWLHCEVVKMHYPARARAAHVRPPLLRTRFPVGPFSSTALPAGPFSKRAPWNTAARATVGPLHHLTGKTFLNSEKVLPVSVSAEKVLPGRYSADGRDGRTFSTDRTFFARQRR